MFIFIPIVMSSLPDFIVHIDRFVVWLEDVLFIVIVRVQKISFSCLIFVLNSGGRLFYEQLFMLVTADLHRRLYDACH